MKNYKIAIITTKRNYEYLLSNEIYSPREKFMHIGSIRDVVGYRILGYVLEHNHESIKDIDYLVEYLESRGIKKVG